jgi:uncharacterized membrane protein YfcA
MEQSNKNKQLNKYLQLTGVAFQMGITIYLGAYFGKKLDHYFNYANKTFTIILTLVALIIAIYSVISQLKSINDKYE